MPRRPRIFEPDRFYHLTSHGIDDRDIFPTDVDRSDLVWIVSRTVSRYALRCYALCLMSTHWHFLVASPTANLGDAMRLINGSYSRRFNERHERRGALFESRFTDRRIRDDDHLRHAIVYIARNPVPSLAARPEDWPWSTYGQLLGVRPPWSFFDPAGVLALVGRDRDTAAARLRVWVAEPEPV